MEVLINIPDSVLKYIEYIPEDVLPEVLTDLVVKGIKTSISLDTEANEKGILNLPGMINVTELLSLLTQNAKECTFKQEESIEEEDIKNEVSSYTVESTIELSDDLDDLDDFMDLMK